jgi:hypothetical protein
MSDDDDKPIWGGQGIGKEINRSPSATWHLLKQGALPASKVGGRWCSTRRLLRGIVPPARRE